MGNLKQEVCNMQEKTETTVEKKEATDLGNGYKLCPKCGAKCRKADKFCMNCGTTVGRQGKKKNVKVAICLGVFLIFLMIVGEVVSRVLPETAGTEVATVNGENLGEIEEQDGEGQETDIFMEDLWERSGIAEVQEKIFPVAEYPYQNEKMAKKLMKTYEKAMKADINEFVYIEEMEKGGVLFKDKMYYTKTIDEEKVAYKYYGKLNKDNEPDGMGILLGKWGDSFYENGQECLVPVYYIGEFKDGYKDGYGIEYRVDQQDRICLKYEGEYKEGKYEGKGVMYSGSIADNIDAEYTTIVQARLFGYSTPDAHTYDCLFPNLEGNKLVSYPILISGVSYIGDMKDGKFDGKGKTYSGYVENGQRYRYMEYEGEFANGKYDGKGTKYFDNGAIQYNGGFRSGSYSGKGTLYDEHGNVLHKGRFKNGEVD